MPRRSLAVLVAVVGTGCVSVQPLTVPMTWKPTDNPVDVRQAEPRGLIDQRFQVLPLSDTRETRSVIGRNIQNPQTPVDITTNSDIGAWCAEQMQRVLGQSGANVVTANPTLILSGDVAEFRVTEDTDYIARVVMRVSLASPEGKTIWKANIAGNARRWGRTFQVENYFEVLSDAFLHAVEDMYRDEGFRAAVKSPH